ncbi:MAG: AMP-binding protein, partial [Bryobacteraceae bacterium]
MDSYARGPAFALTTETAPQVLAETVRKFPDREALIVPHQQIRLSWAQLADEVEKTARGLTGLGLAPGDRVGVWATNCAEWIYLQLGCARAGLVQVNVNPAYRALELAYVLKRSGVKALILRCEDARSKYREILEQAIHGEVLALEHVVYLGEESWDRMIAEGVDIPDFAADCHDVLNIQYTSGTTGSPKGVLLTHHNLLNNGRICAHGLRYTEQDRVCSPVPMYHCFGCVIGTMAALSAGAALILPAPSFDPLSTMQAIHQERATSIYGVPTMFIAQLTHPEFSRFDFSSL